ncbi:MAG: hypothetical protein DSM106950_20680 [Stigonema ocellatum SAG 48.90 = DSM 106950]|nr:hypothetical protein [Stigonema ocellatum SAG 48.90 = DSM 106950]
MKFSKSEIITILTASAGMSGAIAATIGGASCLIGLTGVGTIELGKFIQPHRAIFQKMAFYGGASVGAGLFLSTSGVAIAKRCCFQQIARHMSRRKAAEELMPPQESVVEYLFKPTACQECKYFHGINYNGIPLICAIHPHGVNNEDCPDWEEL